MALIIDGKAVAKEVQKQIREEVEGLERRWDLAPGLAVVLVGDDPGSHIYVRNKEKACKEVGIKSFEHLLPVTIWHSCTGSLRDEVGRADIWDVDIGKARLVRGDWVKPGAVVIDVSVNRLPNGKLCGDVEFEIAKDRASAITPVPGGVGPMTI